jgi:repressor LexA
MGGYLTARQKEILEFVQRFRAQRGYAPTHREICERFGFSSYGTAYKHLKLLAEKGYLRRERHQRRGLEVVPAAAAAEAEGELPYLGRIAAGRPIEAVVGTETIPVPPQLRGEGPLDHYVVRVTGDSMIGEGIHDGDWVVVERRERAATGEMVVALIGDEVTLKRFYPESGDRVRLQPANPAMEPLVVAANDLSVQGIVVGLMRRY